MDKCFFLHKLVSDNDIIINDKTIFSYDDHIKLSKKIINFYDPKTKDLILKMPKQKKKYFQILILFF